MRSLNQGAEVGFEKDEYKICSQNSLCGWSDLWDEGENL